MCIDGRIKIFSISTKIIFFSWGFYIPNFWGLNLISSFLRFSGFLTQKIREKNNSVGIVLKWVLSF